jgi:hypothetical protein
MDRSRTRTVPRSRILICALVGGCAHNVAIYYHGKSETGFYQTGHHLEWRTGTTERVAVWKDQARDCGDRDLNGGRQSVLALLPSKARKPRRFTYVRQA